MSEVTSRQGRFEVPSTSRRRSRPIPVWYDVPSTAGPSTTVLVVMTGRQRNAKQYLAEWCRHVSGRDVLLLVPEMSRTSFPGARSYNQGGVMTRDERVRRRDRWSLGEIDSIVAVAGRRLLGGPPTGYGIYGHSAGAQFVHRLVLLGCSSAVTGAVAANAGWYTEPDLDLPYPYGLGGLDHGSYDLELGFRTPLTVLIGSADVDPDEDGVHHDAVVDRSGTNRRQRGERFVQVSSARATAASLDFQWSIALVPGATHSNPEMSAAAAQVLLGAPDAVSDGKGT